MYPSTPKKRRRLLHGDSHCHENGEGWESDVSGSTQVSTPGASSEKLILGRAESTPEQLVAAQSAILENGGSQEEPCAACQIPRGGRFQNFVSILGLSCNMAALAALVAVLSGFFILYQQNQGLRMIIQSNGLIDPLFQRFPELSLPELSLPDLGLAHRIYEGVPGFAPEWATLSQSLSATISSLSLPTDKFSNVAELFQAEKLPRPGLDLRREGLTPKHPVVIVPGFVTSGLELWDTLPCATHQRRRRIWGTWTMTRSFLMFKQCWLDHLHLDEETGLDPPGVKVRASTGLEAVDYFVAGYYVWARMIESLADLGYDPNNLVTESYDWRLALPNLEKRDAYFTRLKARIEVLSKAHGEKVLVVSHSWGDNVFRVFMAWVTAGNPLWVEQHVAVYANIAGPTLGVPKSISAFLSGETRDTVEMGMLVSLLANAHFTRAERTRLFRTWGGGIGMLPIGGSAIWGNSSWAPDDTAKLKKRGASFGPMMTSWETRDENVEEAEKQHKNLLDTFSLSGSISPTSKTKGVKHLDVDAAVRLIVEQNGPIFAKNVGKWSAVGSGQKKRGCGAHQDGDNFHYSPFECPLPKAPSMQLFCMYGVGNPTERAYHYQNLKTPKAFNMAKQGGTDDPDPTELDVKYRVYSEVNDPSLDVDSGVLLSDGDGTVPLLSLGGLCQKHWREAELNPAGIRVVTREYKHDPAAPSRSSRATRMAAQAFNKLSIFMRGGPRSADHVDILSHEDVLHDLLLLAAGRGRTLEDVLHSRIQSVVDRL